MKLCVVDSNHGKAQKAFIKAGNDVYLCPECGSIMIDVDFEHQQYESDTYYTMIHKTKSEIENVWGLRWHYILNRIFDYGRPASLLDVGAGNGYFVSLASQEYNVDAVGLEISEKEIEFAKDIIKVNLINEDIINHNRKYDVVTSFNVIEHVPDPQFFLAALTERLNQNGILVLTTPNPSCIQAVSKGLKNWCMIDPPHHINLLTRAGLKNLMEKNNLIELKYETLSTRIKFTRKIDSDNLLLKRLFFHALRILNLGADHLLIAQKHAL
jgi:2-polyprenyl-3-methyl-5-hydroxy-6-metoxy-1,4-benzoquinol methylase